MAEHSEEFNALQAPRQGQRSLSRSFAHARALSLFLTEQSFLQNNSNTHTYGTILLGGEEEAARAVGQC